MSIYDLERGKKCKAIGAKLGRDGISERALSIARSLVNNPSYFNAVYCIGRFAVLASCCNYDCYWTEKREMGKTEEFYDLKAYDKTGEFREIKVYS